MRPQSQAGTRSCRTSQLLGRNVKFLLSEMRNHSAREGHEMFSIYNHHSGFCEKGSPQTSNFGNHLRSSYRERKNGSRIGRCVLSLIPDKREEATKFNNIHLELGKQTQLLRLFTTQKGRGCLEKGKIGYLGWREL